MKPVNALKRIVVRQMVDRSFKAIEKHPLLHGEEDTFLDVFNTGIVINIKKTAKRYYPALAETIREIIEKELKKL
jgi:hypothetical protein